LGPGLSKGKHLLHLPISASLTNMFEQPASSLLPSLTPTISPARSLRSSRPSSSS
jgi:hypothetical protein